MNGMAVLALLVAWLLGVLIAISLWPREASCRHNSSVIVPLGLIVGLAATSVTFFAASLISARPALLGGAVEVIVVFALCYRLRTRPQVNVAPLSPHRDGPGWLMCVLAFTFVQAAVVAAVIAWRAYQAEPLGGWDGWTIWNMHARFMLRAGTNWPELLGASQLNWTHPDYPRLVPASVARMWGWSGDEAPFAAALVSLGLAAATLALLIAAVEKLRGRFTALAGGFLLLGTPFFVTFAPNQHADIPLASFMLAAVALMMFANQAERPEKLWILAGVCSGCAAWTKNEGLLFAAVFAAVAGIHLWRTRLWRAAWMFFAALFVALLPVIFFKLRFAPANDLLSAPLGPRLAQLFDPSRHGIILSSLWRDLRGFGEWRFAPWLAMALPFVAWRSRSRMSRTEWLVPSVVGLMLVGYYGVYLLSPQALAWHLDTSLVRLLLQLWPLAIFAWCVDIPPMLRSAQSTPSTPSWMPNRAVFVAVNGVEAAVLVGAMSTQRAGNEFDVRRIGGAEVSAMLAQGWFPIERHDRTEWAWSSGAAKLTLHVSGDRQAGPLSLRFALRSASGARGVTVRERDRVLWEGAVTEELVPITISALKLEAGSTTLEFSTDAPGVAESAAHGGRTLAFGVFNLRLE